MCSAGWNPLCCWRVFRATCSVCMKQRGNGDFDRPHRAIFRIEARYPSDLFNETAHQAKPVTLAFGRGLEAFAIIADGHGHGVDVWKGAPNGHDDRSLAAGKGVVIAVGYYLRDDNPKCRHHIEIEGNRLAVTRQSD